MPRIGSNPYKGLTIEAYPGAETTVVVITCIPNQEGYFAERVSILKLCLASLIKNTDCPFNLMVVDNGCHKDVSRYLHELKQEGVIQILLGLARNIGKAPAQQLAFSCAPGKYIAYSDDDIFFHPGWLSRHLEIINTFPRAGMVGGQVRPNDIWHWSAPEVARRYGVGIEEYVLPMEWIEHWAKSIDGSASEILQYMETESIKNYHLSFNGVESFAGAPDYAFVLTKDVLCSPDIDLSQICRSKKCMGGGVGGLPMALDRAGYLNLSTCKRLTDHIGNHLDDHWRQMATELGVFVEEGRQVRAVSAEKASLGRRVFFRNRLARRFWERVIPKILARI